MYMYYALSLTHTHTHTHTQTHMNMHACTFIYNYMHTHMDTCIHVHMHTWTYAHTLNSITHTLMHQTLLKANALRATTSELYIYIICEQVLFVYVSTLILPRLTDQRIFIYCTISNPGTGADDTFVLKHGMWRNATWPSHSGRAIATSARHFQICFLPEYFDRLFVYLLFVYLVLFTHQAMCNIIWHLRMFI